MRRADDVPSSASGSAGAGEAGPSNTPLPEGFQITLDPLAREPAPGLWFGGHPARVLRLTAEGRVAWEQMRSGPVRTRAQGMLARKLTDAGIAHPVPPRADPGSTGATGDITVIIPVRDRIAALDRCLAALGTAYPVLVVDDASADELGTRAVATRHGARVVRLEMNRGPGGARNAGLQYVTSELVAFVDSDTTPQPGDLAALAAHLADPLVPAAAPRIVAVGAPDGYRSLRSPLDLGAHPARVVPYGRVSYVPSAVLVARRVDLLGANLLAADVLGTAGGPFDPALRVGEDVDLVWRLCARGGRVRYDPSVRVPHAEPATWPQLLRRRFRYGTSAAALGQRHSTSVAPLLISPWFASCTAALLARRPVLAAGAFAGAWLTHARALRQADVPRAGLTRAIAGGVRQTWLGLGRCGVQFAAPVLCAAVARGRVGTRAAALSLLLGPALTEWFGFRNQGIGPVRWTTAHLSDEIAYGAGVYAGCLRLRTTTALRPRLTDRRRRW